MRILLVSLMAVLVTGCGGGGGSEGGDQGTQDNESSETTEGAESDSGDSGGKSYDDIDALADAAGCEEFEKAPADSGSIAAESGGCTLPDGTFAQINWYDDNAARDEFTDLGTVGGGIYYVVGDRWSIELIDEELQDSVAEATGGEKVG